MESINVITNINNMIIDNLFQRIENLMIMHTFLSNIKNDNPIIRPVHPTASMIKESFININNGDILGFNKSYFLKCYKKTTQTMFLVSNKTDYFWNNLFFNSSR
jgi:hypothetical protein